MSERDDTARGEKARNDDSRGDDAREDGNGASEKAQGPSLFGVSRQQGGDGAPTCLSCGAPVIGAYCFACGQKNDDCRRSIIRLAGEAISETFAYDGRVWRTLGQLAARPGDVPTGYSHGRRSRYTPPIRLFLIVSFAFFATLAFTNTSFLEVRMEKEKIGEPGDSVEVVNENLGVDLEDLIEERIEERLEGLDEALDEAEEALSEIDREGVIEQAREALAAIPENVGEVAFSQHGLISREEDGIYLFTPNFTVFGRSDAEEPAEEFDADILFEDADIEDDELARRLKRGVSRVINDPQAFNAVFNAWLPRAMFFMMPAMALLLAPFFRGRDALIYDHLVLSLYVHSVGFLIVTAAVFISYAGIGSSLAGLSALAIYLYFIVAVKRAYGRGWIKTVLAGTFVAWIYLILLVLAVTAITIQAFFSVF